MNAVFVVLAPLALAIFALGMERFEAIVVGTSPLDSAKGRAAEAKKSGDGKGAQGERASD